ncbi:thiamine diphosphokinase [Fonticella tunisiensis]|uniref:Thiamine diphosphokinase n=1 Tax=Fonticella tunisiensis TaxID=1096341 RepID=A0A4R7KQZ8_9CLOT|nr:thiamine diphosphokinase [Fonticella tunisiensis]TDT61632.1 thiamine diphosphokinase [Fonticella tunisiensis]
MKSVIIAHGKLGKEDIVEKECSTADIIICADGGAEYVYKRNIIPDYLVGDFDSIDKGILEHFESRKVNIIRFPKEKDYTDTEICVLKAIEFGSTEICILAGVGSRIDHSLGNIFLLSSLYDRGIRGYIASSDSYIYLCRDEITIEGNRGDIISIIPLKGDAQGIYTSGLKYSLNNGTISFGRAYGVSNEMTGSVCSIKITSGEVLVIKTHDI